MELERARARAPARRAPARAHARPRARARGDEPDARHPRRAARASSRPRSTTCRWRRSSPPPAAVRERLGEPPQVEMMIPLVAYEQEVADPARRGSSRSSPTGARGPAPTIGTMIELPRACFIADRIASVADFFSFGTNDLTQTALGLSRDDVESGFLVALPRARIIDRSPFETIDRPGVGWLVRLAAWVGREARPDLKLGVCGEHGGDPDSIAFFHLAGLDYVSLLAVPRADRPRRRGAGRAPARPGRPRRLRRRGHRARLTGAVARPQRDRVAGARAGARRPDRGSVGRRTPYAAGAPWPVRVDRSWRRTCPRRTSSAGCRRRRSCTPTATRCDIAVARRADRRRPRPGRRPGQPRPARTRRTSTAGRRTTRRDRLTRAARPRGRRAASRPTGTRRWSVIVERSRELLAEPGGWGRFGFYTTGQLFLEEYYTLARHRQGRDRHAAHGRQHAAVHGDGGGGAEGELRHRRPARLLRRRRPLRRDRARGATTSPRRRPCCGCACSTAAAGRTRRGCSCVDPRADAGRARGRRAPRVRSRHERGAA